MDRGDGCVEEHAARPSPRRRPTSRLPLLLACALGLLPSATNAGELKAPVQQVDVQLILAVDSSGSVTGDEYRLQMDGFAFAFRQPAVLQAVQHGRHHAIAVTLFEWSGADMQRQSIPWTVLSDDESLEAFADIVQTAPRKVPGGYTSINAALAFAGSMFAKSGFISDRRVIDVSGDGRDNTNGSPEAVRDRLVDNNVVINGLAILHDEADLKEYYESAVIGGPGAFVVVASDFADFADAMLGKLVQEIAGLSSTRTVKLAANTGG